MRIKIKQQSPELEDYTCSFQKLGLKKLEYKKKGHAKYSPTICVDHIKNERGIIVADHMWFSYNSDFAALGQLKRGEKLVIKTRAKQYRKGSWHDKKDYKLAQPTSVKFLMAKGIHKQMPLKKEEIIGYIMNQGNMVNIGHYSTAYSKWVRNLKN